MASVTEFFKFPIFTSSDLKRTSVFEDLRVSEQSENLHAVNMGQNITINLKTGPEAPSVRALELNLFFRRMDSLSEQL